MFLLCETEEDLAISAIDSGHLRYIQLFEDCFKDFFDISCDTFPSTSSDS